MLKRLTRSAIGALLVIGSAAIPWSASRADNVNAGYDLLETCGTAFDNLVGCTIPGAMFGPGCSGYSGPIQFRGNPLDFFDFGSGPVDVGTADTIIQREAVAGPSFPATINIELVALSLVSISPITVTGCTTGGVHSETWDVSAADATGNALSNSTMTISHQHTPVGATGGGTFTSTLFVCPRLTFTRVSGGAATSFVIDPCTAVGPACEVEVSTSTGVDTDSTAAWSHTAPQIENLKTIGGVTSNFVAGAVAGVGGTQNACPHPSAGGPAGSPRDPDAKQLEDKAQQILGAASHPSTAALLSPTIISVPSMTTVGFVALVGLLLGGLYYMLRRS